LGDGNDFRNFGRQDSILSFTKLASKRGKAALGRRLEAEKDFRALASIKKMPRVAPSRRRTDRERGQAAVFLVLALGIFLIGGVGFVVDGANLWFHRQSAQTAADAACTAGAMDLLSLAAGADVPNSAPTSSASSYASMNGYSSGLSVGNGTFTAINTDCDYIHTVCAAGDLVSNPYFSVALNDPVPTTFMRLVGAGPSVNVPARSTCGLSNVLSYVPVLALNANSADTLTGSGSLSVTFSADAPKTPTKLLQVNSSKSDAVTGFSGSIDLTNYDGTIGNLAVAGQSKLTGGFTLVNAAGITTDPFASIVPPAQPAPGSVLYRRTSSECPGTTCDIYSPGHWVGDLVIAPHGTKEGTTTATGLAVFQPGLYYFDGNLIVNNAATCLRPSAIAGNNGVTFYFHSGTLQVSAQSGQLVRHTFNCQTDAVLPNALACASAAQSNFPSSGITGNVLLAPCSGTYTDINGNQQIVGDPLGTNDPVIGEQRGMLFFQDRDAAANPSWGSASFGLIGNIYIHHCGSGSGSGAACSPAAFDDVFTLGGGTGYIVGDVVVDKLAVNSGLANVSLNPNPQYYVLKASLLQ
jgi:preprotein translocase subunit Sss1